MSWYDTQYKNLQVARSRNKYEERRLQIELERKHGLRAIHEYRLEEVNKEQRLVEKELERIRMGIHRVPAQAESLGSFAHRQPLQSKRRNDGIVQEVFVSDSKNLNDNLSPQSTKDNAFLKAIMCLQSDKDPLTKSNEDRIQPTNTADTSTIDFDSSSVPYRDLSISPRVENVQKTTFVDNSTPNRQHIDLPENEEANVEFVTEPNSDFAYVKQNLSKPSARTSAGLVTNTPRSQQQRTDNITAKAKERQPGFSLDLVSLASLDMKSVKSDVARRMSQQKTSQQTTGKRGSVDSASATNPTEGEVKPKDQAGATDVVTENKPSDLMDGVDSKNADSARPKERSEKQRRTSKTNQPKEIDPSDYNPDGSLKKMYQLPNFEDSWKEAQRARYIRHGKNSEILERERELSVKEIFDKDTKAKGATQ